MVTLTQAQQAIVTKYNLKVDEANGQFHVEDEAVRKHFAFSDASRGRHSAKELDDALMAIVTDHKAMDQALATKKNGNGNGNGHKSKAEAGVTDAVPETDAKPKRQPKVLKANPTPEAKPEATPAPVKGKGRTKAKAAPAADADVVEAQPEPDLGPVDEIELDDGEELDNTGKRERNRKEKVARERGPNRYLRAARIIVDNLSITDKELSKADAKDPSVSNPMSISTSGHCLDAWGGFVTTFLEKGWFKPEVAKQLKDAMQPKDAAKKTSRRK